jgi:hypothetical protein
MCLYHNVYTLQLISTSSRGDWVTGRSRNKILLVKRFGAWMGIGFDGMGWGRGEPPRSRLAPLPSIGPQVCDTQSEPITSGGPIGRIATRGKVGQFSPNNYTRWTIRSSPVEQLYEAYRSTKSRRATQRGGRADQGSLSNPSRRTN